MKNIRTLKLRAKLYLLPTARGGRQTPIKEGVYRPLFSLGPTSASCRIDKIDGGMLAPGGEAEVSMTLVQPDRFGAALRVGEQFDLLEGSRAVGRGVIQQLLSCP